MSDVRLKVNGRAFAGWKRVRVTRGIEAISGGFELSVSDKWNGQRGSWPIVEEDRCELSIGDDLVITGYVDRRRLSYDAQSHSFEVSGRDKAGALVDCSAVLSKWEFANLPVLTLVQKICEPFGITVALDTGTVPRKITLKTGKNPGRVTSNGATGKKSGLGVPNPPKRFSVNPGDSAFEVIDRLCRQAGLLPVSNGRGGLVLTRAGSARCETPLVEGQNILAASGEYDMSGRYARYIVTGQHPGSDEWSGEAVTTVRAEAIDENIQRGARVLLIRAECALTPKAAKNRAGWEAKIRAARGDAVSVTVQGWHTDAGSLWPVNSIVRIQSPLIAVNGEMLITQTVFTLDEGGSTTEITLRRPDAYLPEPTVSVAGTNLWKEIARGV